MDQSEHGPAARTTARYIALEGAEACGKSTQAARLASVLTAVLTRETGGTRIGAKIRHILHDNDNTELDDKAEVLLIAADRAQHMAEVVGPALA
ncbi:MAG TPA: dTMP kinase, partial [Ilumatobacteraceae bacterium]|nr:dTMP kinase [Ilumatobacteraceae bacterium]